MKTAIALTELQRVLASLRAAENLEAVLKAAVAAESHQDELIRANEKLAKERDEAIQEIEEISHTLSEGREQHKEVLDNLAANERAGRTDLEAAEKASEKAIENLRTLYRNNVEEFDKEFEEQRQRKETLLEDLERKISSAQILLQDTRDRFREIA